jgi:hypothetical protein
MTTVIGLPSITQLMGDLPIASRHLPENPSPTAADFTVASLPLLLMLSDGSPY